jgi:hypothetical protein
MVTSILKWREYFILGSCTSYSILFGPNKTQENTYCLTSSFLYTVYMRLPEPVSSLPVIYGAFIAGKILNTLTAVLMNAEQHGVTDSGSRTRWRNL